MANKKTTKRKTTQNTRNSSSKRGSKKNKILNNDIFALIFFIVILLFFPVISCVNNKDTNNFIEELENIPLPTSFIQNKKKSIIFDTPEGRIVEIYTKGRGDKQTVIDFYKESMPQFGWKIIKNHNNKVALRYIKEGEKLDIKITNAEKYNLNLNFELSPYVK